MSNERVQPLSTGPKPGETWIARDGRVAQVFANPDPGTREAYPIVAEYSDDGYRPLFATGRYFATIGLWSPADLTARSPWDAVREAFATGLIRDLRLWSVAVRIQLDSLAALGGNVSTADVHSQSLEFIAWAELRGLTPENLASMRGKVAA